MIFFCLAQALTSPVSVTRDTPAATSSDDLSSITASSDAFSAGR